MQESLNIILSSAVSVSIIIIYIKSLPHHCCPVNNLITISIAHVTLIIICIISVADNYCTYFLFKKIYYASSSSQCFHLMLPVT